MVDRSSASPNLPGAIYAGIAASHSGMCKFENSRAPGYSMVSANLKRFAMKSLGRIAFSWTQEFARQAQENNMLARELLGPGIPPSPPPSPPGFFRPFPDRTTLWPHDPHSLTCPTGMFPGVMLDSVSSFGDPAAQGSPSVFLPSPGRYTALPAPTTQKEGEEL